MGRKPNPGFGRKPSNPQHMPKAHGRKPSSPSGDNNEGCALFALGLLALNAGALAGVAVAVKELVL